MWGRSPRLVFISACHSACLSAPSSRSLFLPAFFQQPLTFKTVIFFGLFSISLSVFLPPTQPVVPGRQLEAVEGPPDVPGLHRDENPAFGSPFQPEETMVGQPKRRASLERCGPGAASAETTASESNVSIRNVFIDMYFVCSRASMSQIHMPVSL